MKDDKVMAKNHTKKTASYKVVSRHSSSKMGKYVAIIVVVLIGCFAAGLTGGLIAGKLSSTTSLNHPATGDGNALVSQNEADIAAVASKVGPSVVAITTQAQTTSSLYGTQTQEGAGSGVIISSDGYILTNKHVVANSTQVSVTTSDGTEYTNVTVVGTDPLNDLAFLKINNVSNLTAATFGDSSTLKIGQNVVAIGNALGEYQNTVTSGIVSGTGRSVTASEGNSPSDSSENLTDLIQTDAAINPGNSGGPLVNLSGQVVGIDTAVAENAQGIGFAIPINTTKGLIKTLLKTGKVTKAFLGVNYVAVTPALAKQYSLPVKQGAYVVASDGSSPIISGSPAEKAGIKDKDIITKVGDQTVGPEGSVSSLLSQYTVGETVPLTIIRAGDTITVNVTLAEYAAGN